MIYSLCVWHLLSDCFICGHSFLLISNSNTILILNKGIKFDSILFLNMLFGAILRLLACCCISLLSRTSCSFHSVNLNMWKANDNFVAIVDLFLIRSFQALTAVAGVVRVPSSLRKMKRRTFLVWTSSWLLPRRARNVLELMMLPAQRQRTTIARKVVETDWKDWDLCT